jgi:hypothetical protein
LLSPTAGSRDNTTLEARGDVLTFTGAVLDRDVEVSGTPVVELVHTSDNPHSDVMVRLCEVDAKGISRNISQAFIRLQPGRRGAGRRYDTAGAPDGVAPLRLDLIPMSHTFRAGTRMRLQISGGSHPQYDRNLGYGEPAYAATAMRPSRHSIWHDARAQSRLQLPVATRAAGGSTTS